MRPQVEPGSPHGSGRGPPDETKLLYSTCSKVVVDVLNHFNNGLTTKLVSVSRFGSFVGKFKAIYEDNSKTAVGQYQTGSG